MSFVLLFLVRYTYITFTFELLIDEDGGLLSIYYTLRSSFQ